MNAPITSSATVSSTISIERTGSRLPPVSVTTVRMRWRARSRSWCRSGRRTSSSSRWRARACGTTTMRAPSRWIRQHRSMSSPWNVIDGSNPPSARNRSARTSRQADGRANTSRTASCCSWSYSPGSVIGSTSPKRSRPSPTCWSTPGSSQVTSLGPTAPALERYSSSTSRRIGVVVERHVVVAEAEEPALTLDEPQHLVGGGSVAGIGAELADERLGQPIEDAPPDVGGAGVAADARRQQEQRVEVRVVLGGQRGEHLVEPRSRAVDDDDRHHRWRERGVGFHGGARLSVLACGGTGTWRSDRQVLTSACNS